MRAHLPRAVKEYTDLPTQHVKGHHAHRTPSVHGYAQTFGRTHIHLIYDFKSSNGYFSPCENSEWEESRQKTSSWVPFIDEMI